MRRTMIYRAAATAVSLAAIPAVALAAGSPEGLWVDQKGRGAVEIKSCGSKKLCGRIVWVSNPREKHGCGQMLLGDLRPVGGGQYDNGWIIDPDSRSKYDLAIERVNSSTLKLTGYMGSKIFSRDLYWKKAPSGLKRCDAPQETAPRQEVAAAPRVPTAPVYSGPKNAPAPERNPVLADFAQYEIKPPRPVPAVRPAGGMMTASAEGVQMGPPLSPEAREASAILSTPPMALGAALPEDVGGAQASPADAIAQRFAARETSQKLCSFRALFSTIVHRCKQ